MSKNTAKEISRKKQWAKDNPDKRVAQSQRAYARKKAKAKEKSAPSILTMRTNIGNIMYAVENIAPFWPGYAKSFRAHLEKMTRICNTILAHPDTNELAQQAHTESNPTAPKNDPTNTPTALHRSTSTSPTALHTSTTDSPTALHTRTESNDARRNERAQGENERTGGNYDPIKYLIAKFPQFAEQPDNTPETPEPPPNNDIILGVMKQYNLEGNFAEQYNAAIAMIKKYPALAKLKYA
jgi:hypothetical protein